MSLITTLADAKSLDLSLIPRRQEPDQILMCPPHYFTVKDIKNAFMASHIGQVDYLLAQQQWNALYQTYQKLGKQVHIIEPVADLEDMVFTANQVLPGLDTQGQPYILLSQMRHASRRPEVPYFRNWFSQRGYQILTLSSPDLLFEGQGDAIWHPHKQLLWGGYGHRTSLAAYQEIATLLNVPIIALNLPTNDFYHLDTCFCLLDTQTAMIFPPAFDQYGLELIYHFFPRIVEVPTQEAYQTFACNAFALGPYVIIQQNAAQTIRQLKSYGFQIVEVDTGEFIKSGGSVFCMKMLFY